MNKNKIRKKILEIRDSLSLKEKTELSKIIIKKVQGLNEYKNAETVLFYYPVRNEVDVTLLLETAIKEKTVCLPKIEDGKRQMSARNVESIQSLKKGVYGIMEPLDTADIIQPEEIDFVIVPLVAFDDKLHRVGYGGGYYDTYLSKCKNAFLCGVAYNFQEVENIPPDGHDISLNLIVTEV